MAQRIKGQEVVVKLTGPSGDVGGLEDILSATFTFEREILEEEYLGKKSKDYDDIYVGCNVELELHMSTTAYLTFARDVNDRSQRRQPSGNKYNVSSTFQFPGGERARLVGEDLFFGEIPLEVGGRAEYVKTKVTAKCSNLRIIV